MDKREQEFRNVMTHYRAERVSPDFIGRVMEEVRQLKPAPVQKPVFSRWFLTGLSVLFVVFIASSFDRTPARTGGKEELISACLSKLPQTDWSVMNEANRGIVNWFGQIPPVLLFALLGIAVLLVLDRLFQQQRNLLKTP